MIIVLTTVFFSSCKHDNVDVTSTEDISIQEGANLSIESSTVELTEDNPILLALKSSEAVSLYNKDSGELLWDMATMITYNSDEALPFILIPIDNGDEQSLSMFVAAYNEKKSSFHSFLNDFDLSNISDLEENGYTGKIEYKSVENTTIRRKIYEKGMLAQEQDFDVNDISLRGVDVSCWLDCMKPHAVNEILSGLTFACGSSASCCIGFPSHLNPCCLVTAACALYKGGIAGYCAWQCWE